jgi:hypothetical protein
VASRSCGARRNSRQQKGSSQIGAVCGGAALGRRPRAHRPDAALDLVKARRRGRAERLGSIGVGITRAALPLPGRRSPASIIGGAAPPAGCASGARGITETFFTKRYQLDSCSASA